MAKTDISKSSESSPPRHRDLLTAMRDEMDRVFEQFERGFPRWPSLFQHAAGRNGMMMPELDVRENADTITVEADLPGVDENEVSVTVADGVLTIKGEKKQEKEETKESFHVSERSYGAFERSIRLPDSVDETKVEASFDKGVLKIKAAKKPDAAKAERKIEIKKGA